MDVREDRKQARVDEERLERKETVVAAIFDVDGTLVDTVDMHARAWQEALEYFGRPIDFESVRRQIGKGGDQLLPVFLEPDEIDAFGDDLLRYRSEHWRLNYLPRVRPFECTRELFERIRRDGKRIVVASSAKREDLDHYLRIAHVADLIDGAVSASDVARSKPAPDMLLEARRIIDLDTTTQIAVIGDSPYDAEAANEVGLPTIALRSGGFTDRELLDAGAIELYNDPADLLRHYEQSFLGS